MVAHERYITVTKAGSVTVSGLPVQEGQRVRVIVSVEEHDRAQLAEEMRAFFKQIQALPHIQQLTEEEIAEEIAAYRRSRGA